MASEHQKNFKLTIEYDGSNYHGWQRQKDLPSIQGTIETAIATMVRRPVVLIGSGRTDAGVHALGQSANFHCATRLSADDFQKGLTGLLPDDIVIRSCCVVPDGFHARYDAESKTYQYRILNHPLPSAVGRQYSWFIRNPLDWKAMKQALEAIRGSHDFSAFEGSGSPRSHSVRHVFRAEIFSGKSGRFYFEIEADGFLRFMVRNIVGTLVAIGHGRLSPADMAVILASGDRGNAAATAPPHGLFLISVQYPS